MSGLRFWFASQAYTPLSMLRRESHYTHKKQTPVNNPFNLEQSRLGLWVKEGTEHLQSIAGRRFIVLLVLFSDSKFLIPFWP